MKGSDIISLLDNLVPSLSLAFRNLVFTSHRIRQSPSNPTSQHFSLSPPLSQHFPSHDCTKCYQAFLTYLSLQVDFNQVAEKCGQKYPKNARSAAKNLWAKLKTAGGTAATASVTSPSAAAAAKADTPEGSDDEAEGAAKKTLKSPAKSPAKKGTAKATPAKKGVGRTTTPKKAGDVKKTPAKATKAKKVVKAEEVAADEDEEMIEVDSSAAKKEDTEEDPEGLSTFPFQHSEDTHAAGSNEGIQDTIPVKDVPSAHLSEVAAMPARVPVAPLEATQADITAAAHNGVSIEDYMAWKAENNYDFWHPENAQSQQATLSEAA